MLEAFRAAHFFEKALRRKEVGDTTGVVVNADRALPS